LTSPITYPPGQISTWGINQALTNQFSTIAYTGVDGSVWYLAGPQAPLAGAQDGMVLRKHMGLMAPFEMLELRGARQDGATWTDAVYDVGDMMLSLEASGIGPQNIRDVIRHWVSAWDPRQTGKLSVFTPDMGEWWAPVRQGKNISDQFDRDYTWSGRQQFTWNVKNYDAFWYGVDSTSSVGLLYDSVSEDFTTQSNASTLGGSWNQLYSSTAAGTYGISNGAAYFLNTGTNTTVNFTNIYTAGSSTDNQVVTLKLGQATLANLFRFDDPASAIDLWVRCNSPGSYSGITGVRLRLQLDTFKLSYFIAGTEVDWFTLPLVVPPGWGDEFTLIAGTNGDPYNFSIQRDGLQMFQFQDGGHLSQLGSGFRHWGFGGATHNFGGLGMTKPQPIGEWFAGDNGTVTQSNDLTLTNIGDVEAWPRYLCYGPGTFNFTAPNGNVVSFGPLEEGQIVLLTTQPQYRSVVDLTPNQPSTQQLNKWETLMLNLISFATNNNTPPLLQRFESFFGILPPQGALYTLLNGRFTYSIPGSAYGVAPNTATIGVNITGGDASSGVVGAVTPRRRWPL
jgi:hypothetical protein